MVKKDTAHTSIMRVMTRYLKKDPIYNVNPMKVRRGKIAKVVGFPCEQEAFFACVNNHAILSL